MLIASWRKCDFQIHSPRDPNWIGPRPIGIGEIVASTNLPAVQKDVDAERHKWAEAFVDACALRGLGAIALTDHHEMVVTPYVQKAVAMRKEADPSFDLWVFPAMELTAKNGVQCLVIFDADLTENWWQQAMGKLGIQFAAIEALSSRGQAVTQLHCSYSQIGTQLDELPGLRGRHIVLPNVSEGGQNTALKQSAHAEFKSTNYVGGYLDCGQTIENLGTTNKTRLSGQDAKWSARPMYPIPTSDSRTADFSKLGKNDAWIKLAAPTAEAIRQAFLCSESRIGITLPRTPTLFVKSLEVNGSSIFESTQSTLSPELNSVIGGRGSGKSTLLEYLSFALGRSSFDVPRDHYSNSERMKSLIKDTILAKNARVAIKISQDGALFQIVRGPATSYQP